MQPTKTDLSRRDAFRVLGLAAGTVALGGRITSAETPSTPAGVLPQGAGFYRMHVGDFEITVISDGGFPFTPYPTIGSNATEAAVNILLKENFIDPAGVMGQVNVLTVRKANGPVTLVDTGSGKLFGPAAGFAKQNLIASGVQPEQVETVVFTHLHPDHVGGAIGEDGKPVFANAKHWVSKPEYDFWTGASPDLSKSGVPEAMQPMMIGAAKDAITKFGDRLQTINPESEVNKHLPILEGKRYEIAPGFTAVLTGGHTPGHCVLVFESNGQSLVYVTDLIINSILCPAHPEWLVGFDTDMQATVEIRKTLYARLAESRVQIAGPHLPFPSVGHLKKSDDGFAFLPSPWRWA